MNLDEVLAQERILAKAPARMPFSPLLTIYYSQRRYGTSGEVYITERCIGFKGRTGDFKIKVLLLSLILVVVGFSQLMLAYMVNEADIISYLFNSPNGIIYFIILGSLALLILLSIRREKRLSKGFVWSREGFDISISGQTLFIIGKEGLTRIDFDDETNEILRILGNNIVEFEISDLSGLDYHEKMDILEQRFRDGKLSKELYEELKKRLPYV